MTWALPLRLPRSAIVTLPSPVISTTRLPCSCSHPGASCCPSVATTWRCCRRGATTTARHGQSPSPSLRPRAATGSGLELARPVLYSCYLAALSSLATTPSYILVAGTATASRTAAARATCFTHGNGLRYRTCDLNVRLVCATRAHKLLNVYFIWRGKSQQRKWPWRRERCQRSLR